MALPRPSLTMILDVDERMATDELRLEVNRCYAYIGTALVRTHPAPEAPEGEEAPIENTMQLLVRLGTRHYLDSADEESDELWNDVMERWFANQFHKVGNQTLIFNKRQREIGNPELPFSWFDIELENGKLHVKMRCNDVSSIDDAASAVLTQVRDAYNSGKLGDKAAVKCISMPTDESWAAQVKAGAEAAAIRAEEEARAAEEAARAEKEARAAAEAAAQEAFLESPELMAEDAEAEADANGIEGAEGGLEPPELIFELDEPSFDVVYDQWCVEYTDGTTKVVEA